MMELCMSCKQQENMFDQIPSVFALLLTIQQCTDKECHKTYLLIPTAPPHSSCSWCAKEIAPNEKVKSIHRINENNVALFSSFSFSLDREYRMNGKMRAFVPNKIRLLCGNKVFAATSASYCLQWRLRDSLAKTKLRKFEHKRSIWNSSKKILLATNPGKQTRAQCMKMPTNTHTHTLLASMVYTVHSTIFLRYANILFRLFLPKGMRK